MNLIYIISQYNVLPWRKSFQNKIRIMVLNWYFCCCFVYCIKKCYGWMSRFESVWRPPDILFDPGELTHLMDPNHMHEIYKSPTIHIDDLGKKVVICQFTLIIHRNLYVILSCKIIYSKLYFNIIQILIQNTAYYNIYIYALCRDTSWLK